MRKLKKNKIDDVIQEIVYILALVLLTLYFINQIYFYLNKHEINAKIIDLIENRSGEYDKVVLEFPLQLPYE
jgi:hypothetical protein